MKTTKSTWPLLTAASLLCIAAGCKDDAKKATPDAPDKQIDAGIDIDAPDAAPACTTAVIAPDFNIGNGASADVATWSASVTTDLGGGGPSLVQFEFYAGIETTLMGTFDLTAGNQANYQTCAACIRVFSSAADGTLAKQFFQDGGSITLTEDPLTNLHMLGTATDVSLIEVEVDAMFHSTPVVGGVCLTLGSLTLDADAIPAGWTCANAAYNDGTSCDCACGVHDPDCDIAAAPVVGCTGAQVCSSDVCTDTCNVLSAPPVGCTTGTCGFDTATQDICYTDAALVDPAVIGGACAAGPFLCAVVNTVATGVCDTFVVGDNKCREACDANADCNAGDVCSPIVGAKGVCITPPGNDKCETATLLVIGTPVNGTTAGAAKNYNAGLEPATCTGIGQPGSDVAYQVLLTAGQAITVTLSNVVGPSFDPSVAILGPGTAAGVCNVSPVVCLAGADAGFGGDGETFTFTATATGIHFLIVDSFSATRTGSFTLNVTSP